MITGILILVPIIILIAVDLWLIKEAEEDEVWW